MRQPNDHARDANAVARAQRLPVNRFEHLYLGGRRISAFRGSAGGTHQPEEWLGSTIPRFGKSDQGLSRLSDGTLLRDAVDRDPTAWLGSTHLETFGTNTELLVKLLDPDQRLPVHLHPDRAFAQRYLGVSHGKTEAWIVMETTPGAMVHFGFRATMHRDEVRAMVDVGDFKGLVDALRPHAVDRGDAVLVPAGVPHCIDAGLFILELQEPTDLSILLESEGFAVDKGDMHLGLGMDVALEALRLDALEDREVATLVVHGELVSGSPVASLLPSAADPWFRAHRIRPGDMRVDAGFGVLLVTAGEGILVTAEGDRLALQRGDAAVVAWASGAWGLEGPIEAIVCRPPDSAAALRAT